MSLVERLLRERHERTFKLLESYEVDGRVILTREVSSRTTLDTNFEYLMGEKNVGAAAAIVHDGIVEGIVHEIDKGMFEAFSNVGKLYTYRKYEELLSRIKERVKGKTLLADYVEIEENERRAFSSLNALTSAMKEFLEKYATLKPAGEFVLKLRGVKTPGEVEALKKATEYSREIAEELPNMITEGMTERELASKLYAEIRRYGEPSFPVIVAFHENTANPHHRPSYRRLESNGPILVDFGVRYGTMCADTTRMYYHGSPTEDYLLVHEAVYEAKNYVEEHLKPGITGKEAHEMAVEYLRERGYAEYFTHSLGHALGLETHDIGPGLNPYEKRKLEPFNVVTVEPGVYLPKRFGVRLEDDVVITEGGVERLIHVPKTVIIV